MRRTQLVRNTLTTVIACTAAVEATAAIETTASPGNACPDHVPVRQAYFGDLHVHTSYCLDASTQQTRTLPAEAYAFARGHELGLQPFDDRGQPLRRAKLARPLDFAAVTDHAELPGETSICKTPGLPGHVSIVCNVYRRWPRVAFFWMNFTANTARRHDFCGEDGAICRQAARSPWEDTQLAAAEANQPCEFTTFVAYEWTGAAGAGNNLHRNVIFENSAVPELPDSFIETPSPPQLWDALDRGCRSAGTGCDVVVIPHNSNLSAGRMFRVVDENGSPIGADEAQNRQRFERLVEIMQHKGDSECMPGLNSSDELCGFEKLAVNNFSGRYWSFLAEPPLARQFVRNILKEGLRQESRLGTNPFQFGLTASTDTHLGTPGLVEETEAFLGHGGAGLSASVAPVSGLPDDIEFNPGGLAAVWAARDPGAAGHRGAPLERLQLIKGWLEAGELHERVIQLAGSAVADASVDPNSCRTTGHGFDALCRVWEDSDFDPQPDHPRASLVVTDRVLPVRRRPSPAPAVGLAS